MIRTLRTVFGLALVFTAGYCVGVWAADARPHS